MRQRSLYVRTLVDRFGIPSSVACSIFYRHRNLSPKLTNPLGETAGSLAGSKSTCMVGFFRCYARMVRKGGTEDDEQVAFIHQPGGVGVSYGPKRPPASG